MRNLWLLFLVGLSTGFLSEPLFVFSQSSSTDDLYIEGQTSGDFPVDDEDGDDGSGSGSGDYAFNDISKSEEKLWTIVNFTETSLSEEIPPLQPQPTAVSAHNPATTAAARQEPAATVKDSEKIPFVSSDGNNVEKEVPGIGPTVGSPRSTVRPPIKTTAAEFGAEDLEQDNSLDRWNVVTPKDEVVIKEIENDFEVAVGRDGRLHDINSPKEVTSENLWERTEVLAAVIACGVVGFLCAVFLLLLLAYRMKKKDEGSYDLGDTKLSTTAYHKAPIKEFYA